MAGIRYLQLLNFLVIFGYFFWGPTRTIAQSTLCDPETPYYYVDLSGNPDSAYISPQDVRDGLCCGLTITSPPPRCIEFEVLLDSNAVGLAFDIYSGARPPGALFYQINCGPLIPIGDSICLDGVGPHTLTFCKPGNNPNEYYIKSLPGRVVPEDEITRAGCDTEIGVSGFIESTIVWRDITSPNGEFLAYLDCTSGCDTVRVSTQISAPTQVQYEICGIPETNGCQNQIGQICDTVSVTIIPPLEIRITPDPPIFCVNDVIREMEAIPNIASENYVYQWFAGPNGTGPLLGTDSIQQASVEGFYSVIVFDSVYPDCAIDTATEFFQVVPIDEVNVAGDSTICFGDTLNIIASGSNSYVWTPSTGLSCDSCANPFASPSQNTIYQVVSTDINGCLDTALHPVVVFATYNVALFDTICSNDSVSIAGNFYGPGSFLDTLQSVDGCDSILTIEITGLPTSSSFLEFTICQGDSMLIHGNFETNSALFVDTLMSQNGCDSVSSINLIVHPEYLDTISAEICQGDSVFLEGAFQTTAGFYTNSFLTNQGCDSLIVVDLSINPTYVQVNDTSICEGSSILLGGQFQTLAGTYIDSLQTFSGCDSVIITNLSILPTYVDTVIQTICQGDSLLAGGEYQFAAGFYIDSLLSASNCDSVIVTDLRINPTYLDSVEMTICEGDSVFLENAFRFVSGLYFDSLSTVNGCDSVIQTRLTVIESLFYTDSLEICEGDSIEIGGQFRSVPGIYQDTVIVDFDCDSIITFTLFVNPSFRDTIEVEICQGDSIQLIGQFRTNPGFYTDSLATGLGCDSLITYDLKLLPVYQALDSMAICQGDSLFVGGAYQTIAGLYVDSLQSQDGCDSILLTQLVVNPIFADSVELEICDGDSVLIDGIFRTEVGLYQEMYNTSQGCDSIIYFTLDILPTYLQDSTVAICQGDSIALAGMFRNTAGFYVDSLTAVNGCDSLIQYELIVHPNRDTTLNRSICQGDSIFLAGGFRNSAGIYRDSLLTVNGCDSIIAYDLSILPVYQALDSMAICQGDSLFVGGAYQTIAGLYVDSLQSQDGCDSILLTQLTVNPIFADSVELEICDGDSVLIDGIFRTDAGLYQEMYNTSQGCDSIIYFTLNILPTYLQDSTLTICQGDSIALAGMFRNTAGFYVDSLTTVSGCDSLIQYELIVHPNRDTTLNRSICQGDSIFLAGAFRNNAGIYRDSLLTVNGCDSIIAYDLSILPVYQTLDSMAICQGDSLFVGGAFQTIADLYVDSLQSQDGCDSILLTQLIVHPVFEDSVELEICDGDSVLIDGIFRTETGLYQEIYNTSQGCDSIIYFTLNILPTYFRDSTVAICEGDSIVLAGMFRNTAGLYMDSLTAVNGCDSIIMYNLMVHMSNEIMQMDTICEGDSIMIAGAYRSSPGIYTDSLINSLGCDSTVITDLFVRMNPDLLVDPVDPACKGDTVELMAFSDMEINWEPAELVSCHDCQITSTSPPNSTMFFASITGCNGQMITDSVLVRMMDPPQIQVDPVDTTVFIGNRVNFSTNIQGLRPFQINWFMQADSMLCDNCETYSSTFTEDTEIIIEVMDSLGCENTALARVRVERNCIPGKLEIPNVITPNGDGLNDNFFFRYPEEIELLTVQIYSRWGQKVFEGSEAKPEWDGTYQGQLVNPGVFGYFIEFICPEGNRFTLKGNVTVLR